MAEAITIPSPSVFLRPSPPPQDPPASQPNAPKQQNVRRPGSAEGKKKAPRKPVAGLTSGGAADGAAVVKPKQSKSRNGIDSPSLQCLAYLCVQR